MNRVIFLFCLLPIIFSPVYSLVPENGSFVRKVLFDGLSKSKDKYSHHYCLQVGDVFDQSIHQSGLDAIERALHVDGYCACTVIPRIDNDGPDGVAISIELQPGPVFIVDGATIRFAGGRPQVSDWDDIYSALIALGKSLKSARYSHALRDETVSAIRRTLQQQGFSEVIIDFEEVLNVKKSTIFLRFKVTLGKRTRYVFQGNSFFTNAQLIDQIMLYGQGVPAVPKIAIAEEISNLYKQVGFLDVEVALKEEEDAIEVEIQEGCQNRIRGIDCHGLTEVGHINAVDNFFNVLTDAPYYKQQNELNALDAMTEYFLKNGYWDFAILSKAFVATGRNAEKDMCITIHLGEQRFLTSVTVEGFEYLSSEYPFDQYACINKPVPFNMYIISETQAWLSRFLQRKGFLYSTFRPEFVHSDEGIALIWKLAGPDEPVRFGTTTIVGSGEIPDFVLTRELSYREGDVFNTDAIYQSIARLTALNIFNSVILHPENLLTPEACKLMILKVTEDDPIELRARLGGAVVSSANLAIDGGFTYRAGGALLWKNPTKRADILRLDTDFTRYTAEVALSYTMPWLLWWPVKTTTRLYTSHYEQPFVVGSLDILYQAIRNGWMTRFEGRDYALDWAVNTGFEWLKIDQLSRRRAAAIRFEPNLVDEAFPYFVCEPSLFYETLDNKVQPTSGILSVLTVRGFFPFTISGAWFVKFLAEQSIFFPLAQWCVMGVRARFGHIVNAEFERIMPPERFFLGGAYSLRAYEPDLAPPLNLFREDDGDQRLVPVGGKSMINVNLEWRFPLIEKLSAVIFTDVGVLSQNSITAIMNENVLGASGFGLRYNTPVGPLRFDIGWKWQRHVEGERAYAWFLTLGQAF